MDSEDRPKSLRLHIGNISKALAEKHDSLMSRLNKFGTVKSELELRTKPVNDFFYAFVDVEISPKQLERLKSSLHGALYMGRKLTISQAKQDFQERWKKDATRPQKQETNSKLQSMIAETRRLRILELTTKYPCNSITGVPIAATTVTPNSTSCGYFKSPHTFNNASAQTKNHPPQHNLIGKISYGATLKPKGCFSQQYSKASGRGEVIRGRHRTSARPAAYFARKQQTMRTLINGELKQIRCYKAKLWGVEKKTVGDLTFRFYDNAWRSGDDHIVERVEKTPAQATCAISGPQAEQYGAEAVSEEPAENEEDNFQKERAANEDLLRSLFATHDFDKPVDVEEEKDEPEHFDFEAHGILDSDEEETPAEGSNKTTLEEYLHTHERPTLDQPYDEDDEGNEMEVDQIAEKLTTEAIKQQYDQEHQQAQQADKSEQTKKSDETGQAETETAEQKAEQNHQETLRSLFNPEEEPKKSLFAAEPGFKLGLDESDDDIDYDKKLLEEEDQKKLLEQIRAKQEEEKQQSIQQVPQSKKHFGLFWAHFDSPFLQTQTQLNKLGNLNEPIVLPGEDKDAEVRDDGHGDEDGYERWFWLMRGEISRECKRKKRDVLKNQKKRRIKPTV